MVVSKFTTFGRAFRRALGLLLVALFLVNACRFADAQDGAVPQWIGNAPGEFVRLIDRGKVAILVNDEIVRQAGKSAITRFEFSVKYDFKFRYDWIQNLPLRDGWQAKIVAWIDKPQFKIEHKVYLQSTFAPSDPWQSKLLRHEFDHVSISTDPRLNKLIQRVLQRRRTFIAKWEQESMPKENEIRARIQEVIDLEIHEIENMIQIQYDLLDKESRDGIASIGSRKDFFNSLYTVPGLERCRFEYVEDVRGFVNEKLGSPAIQKEVDSHYLFLGDSAD